MDINAMVSALRNERQRLDQAIAALEGLDNTGARASSARKRSSAQTGEVTSRKPRKRRHMSPAARRRMSKMMKARWAAKRKAAKKA